MYVVTPLDTFFVSPKGCTGGTLFMAMLSRRSHLHFTDVTRSEGLVSDNGRCTAATYVAPRGNATRADTFSDFSCITR